MKDKDNEQSQSDKTSQVMKYTGLGTQMLVLIGLGTWGGLKLDEKWHVAPLFLIVLPLLGLGISLYQIYKQLIGNK